MTEFHVEVVRIGEIEKHPSADTLSITQVHGGYPVIFKTGTYKPGDLAVYVPVDSIVPDTAEWAWLAPAGASLRDKDRRIKAKRLRGVFSMGLLTDAAPSMEEGEDVARLLGITKYEPPADNAEVSTQPRQPRHVAWYKALFWRVVLYFGLAAYFGGVDHTRLVNPPRLKYLPGTYDIEPFRKHGRQWFEPGEIVVVTEKVHGQNASYVHDGKKLHVKSRTRWRRNDPNESQNTWARVAKKYSLEEKLKAYPGIILFGETYGNNADMPYGVDRQKDGDEFVAFDAFNTNTNEWLDYPAFTRFCQGIEVPIAPILGVIFWSEFQYDTLLPLSEGPSNLAMKNGANHIREGFVVRPWKERKVNGGQRVILKMAGESYLTRKAA